LRGDGILLRMETREADLYGQRALAVLSRAREKLCKKFGVKLDQTVTVEVFPRKQDFAVRTFGLPGADGFLGVCFGPVITAISPAPQGENPSNWEAVLWHEFCHTVTLHKSRNRMPRWLSEGISVYEERQENPTWGQWLNPRYREMILGEDLTPLSQLSSAFLAPKSRLHLSFAYFESALAVEFLVKRYGREALNGLLDDLGAGVPTSEALVRRTTALKRLDAEFAKFARERARNIAPRATWEKVDLADDADSAAVASWVEKHPNCFWGLQRLGTQFALEKKWPQAEKTLTDLQKLYPDYIGEGNAYELLALVYRQTARPERERAVLEQWAEKDSDAIPAYLRLMALCEEAKDWAGLARNARRLLAVNPLTPAPHRALARAAERLGEREEALTAYQALLAIGDPDLANLHYRRALLLRASGRPKEARREVLMALEVAPRFLEAHRLLLDLVEGKPAEGARSPETKP
jgi:tetratricopeptide (TPR) repeat protein